MKKSLISLAAAALLGAASFSAMAHGGSGTVSGQEASSISTTSVSAFAGNGGSSIQGAHASGSATINAGAMGTAVGVGPLKTGTTAVDGSVTTTSTSIGGGLVSGNATGTNAASNLSTGAIKADGNFHTVTNGPTGVVKGNAEGVSGTSVNGSGNSLGIVSGGTASNFASQASASQIKIGNFNTVKTDSTSVVGATAGKDFTFAAGNTVVNSDFQAAANAYGQAKVGAQTTTSGN